MLLRHHIFDPVGPLHETNAFAFKVLVRPKLEELSGMLQTISLEVIDWQTASILLDQHKGRAADHSRIGNAQPLGHGSHEMRFPRPQRTDQGNHGSAEKLSR